MDVRQSSRSQLESVANGNAPKNLVARAQAELNRRQVEAEMAERAALEQRHRQLFRNLSTEQLERIANFREDDKIAEVWASIDWSRIELSKPEMAKWADAELQRRQQARAHGQADGDGLPVEAVVVGLAFLLVVFGKH